MRKTFHYFEALCMVMSGPIVLLRPRPAVLLRRRRRGQAGFEHCGKRENLAPSEPPNTVGVLNFTNQTGLDDLIPFRKVWPSC